MTDVRRLRAAQIEQNELWEELQVEHQWFHVVRGMIHRGSLREMGPMGWAVYCVLKAHTNLSTGEARPSIKRIAELIGVSHDTVQRAIQKLTEMGIVQSQKRGRANEYTLIEAVPMTTSEGDLFGFGERPYAPLQFQSFIDELARFARTGNLPGDRNVTINVTLNVQQITQGDHGQVTMNVQNVQMSPDAPAEQKAAIDDIKKRVSRLKYLGD